MHWWSCAWRHTHDCADLWEGSEYYYQVNSILGKEDAYRAFVGHLACHVDRWIFIGGHRAIGWYLVRQPNSLDPRSRGKTTEKKSEHKASYKIGVWINSDSLDFTLGIVIQHFRFTIIITACNNPSIEGGQVQARILVRHVEDNAATVWVSVWVLKFPLPF